MVLCVGRVDVGECHPAKAEAAANWPVVLMNWRREDGCQAFMPSCSRIANLCQ